VTLFRQREPSHVQLAREGGIPLENPEPRAPWDAAGIHGLHRAREWDAVLAVSAPEVEGERVDFVALPGAGVVVEQGPERVDPLVEALDRELPRPYRAEAVRREGGLWAAAGRRIELVELPGVRGDDVEVAVHGSERTLLVDGEHAFGSVPALERPEHAVRARRVDGDLWEIEAHPL
jgi:hypothetical protein